MKAPCIGMEGKMLPDVSNTDNGNVLTVVNGEWGKAVPSSGSASPLEIKVVYSDDIEEPATLDKTFEEILEAFPNCYLLNVTEAYTEYGLLSLVDGLNGTYAVIDATGIERMMYTSDSIDGVLTQTDEK